MSDQTDKPSSSASGLLGDLESIRTLLDEEQERSEGEVPGRPAEEDVPLLEDVVRGGVSLNESFLEGEGDFADSGESGGLDEDVFKALLSDEWRDSARGLLDEARGVIEQHQTEWTPAHTDELNAALKVRIDQTLEHWLHDLVQRHIGDLREALLRSVGDELETAVRRQFDGPLSQEPKETREPHEDPDGE